MSPERPPAQPSEKALARLSDSSPSRVGVDGATRARDVSRPDEADLEAAEREVVVRRARRPST